MADGGRQKNLTVHGTSVRLDCNVPFLDDSIHSLVSDFQGPTWHNGAAPIAGRIHPCEYREFVGRLYSSTPHIARSGETDIFHDGNLYYLADDRWGMSEIDIATGQWQSWIHRHPHLDPIRVTEQAVLMPLAQVLRPRGLHLLPAVSAVKDGFAFLMICPFGLQAELSAMAANGYKMIGQRWTAVREEDGRLALLHVPGRVERFTTPTPSFGNDEAQDCWVDLTRQHPGSRQSHAFCDAVLIADPDRRGQTHYRELDSAGAVSMLDRQWPIINLDHAGQPVSLARMLGDDCRCFEVQLSRNTKEFLGLLHSIRHARTAGKTVAA